MQKADSGLGHKSEKEKLFQDSESDKNELGAEPVKSKSPSSKKAVEERIPKKEGDVWDFDKGISRWKKGQKKIILQKAQKKYRLQKEQKRRRLQKEPNSEGLKTINLKTKLEKGKPENISEVFETEKKLTFLTEIPASCKKEDINLRYYFKNGGGHLIIYAGSYQRHIQVSRKTALKLKGTPPEFVSLKNGVLSVEMNKS